ncbi:MAG: thrombospondin type 3 repeat-containing protein, partial [Thermoplasmata archaeon]|nr:thrombospondin type 3 repeat-containing protein [Thermoplasmata archaeon]
IDIDGDGIINSVDPSPYNNTGFQDSDGDGTADSIDAFPYNPNEWVDSDGDGIGNNADLDDDNDGVHDVVDLYPFDSTRTDIRTTEDTTINVGLDKAPNWTAPLAIIVIGAVLVLLMWLLFGRRRGEEVEILPKPAEEEVLTEEALSTELDEILGESREEEISPGASEDTI